jgi:hypothetical protein
MLEEKASSLPYEYEKDGENIEFLRTLEEQIDCILVLICYILVADLGKEQNW